VRAISSRTARSVRCLLHHSFRNIKLTRVVPVLVDLFIRTGLLTPENEPHFLELTTRMRGRFEYERWLHL
jgi:thiosulfate reductase cytochrome b subunit